MEKIQLHLYKYEDSQFKQIAIIDDYQEYSFEHNLYQAGQFTVTINFNIPNARLFERGLFIKFGEDKYCFGEILTISDTVGPNGKGSQIRNITGFDIRYLLKRRVIKNMNNGGNWVMTDKGEICLRNLINDQCGANAENKRKLPIINTIPLPANAIGKEYSVSEEFSNLYEVCKTIATQSEFGWHIKFENGLLTLECFEGNDLHNSVFFSPDFDSLASGNLSDSNNSFSNAIYVAGKGQNEERDLYEGETVENDVTPEGMGRFESFDNQSQMTTEDEYKAEAFSMLAQYGQTLEMTGQGLIKCPYVFKEQYNVGDKITLSFNNKKSVVQILSVTERSVKGTYSLNFNFGKPENTLKDQLQIILRKLQMASNKGSAVDCVKWYTIPTDSEMNKADVTFNTIGFTGTNSNQDFTFTLYTDDEKSGSKNYMAYIKNLIGTGKLILTSGKQDAQNLSLLGGTYIADIFVDEDGNVKLNSATPTTVIEANNPMPATSGAVYKAIQQGASIDDTTVSTVKTWSSEKINDSLAGKAGKNAILNSLEVVNGNTAAQIIPWNDGTHYRGYEDRSGDIYTDIITKDGAGFIAKIEHGTMKKYEELATMDKVVKDSSTAVETLYVNPTGDFLKSDMNLTATKSGILKVSFSKKQIGYTLFIYINDILKYVYPNFWGENVYETAYVPVNKGDNIRINSDVYNEGMDRYRVVNVIII